MVPRPAVVAPLVGEDDAGQDQQPLRSRIEYGGGSPTARAAGVISQFWSAKLLRYFMELNFR
jgi:hypothetical protein